MRGRDVVLVVPIGFALATIAATFPPTCNMHWVYLHQKVFYVLRTFTTIGTVKSSMRNTGIKSFPSNTLILRAATSA
jgi:hypothetical protein